MQNLIHLLLRRMRLPLIVIILTYAISVLGLVLIPGVDDQGNPWHMSFFHAFYFVSFMGSTIGFGEVPYPFTDPQRLWTTVAIYLTVISWLYAIGSLFALFQDQAFRRIVAYTAFTRAVRNIREPFYLICGLGDAGHLVVRELAERGIRSVVIDRNGNKIESLRLENFPVHVPGLSADVTDATTLIAAGLKKKQCAGVIALTDADHANLMIAISSKLLAPRLPVICRAESHDFAANMASFGTDYIINPFDTFAKRFAMMFQSPSMYLVYEWMISMREAPLSEFASPPGGTWILCGFGRFGKAVRESLSFKGVRIVLVESDIIRTRAPEGTVEGRGTEAITLHEAGIDQAVGIIAGTDDDANNLSIIMTALDLNENLFTVARQNLRSNDAIFAAANIDMTMQTGRIIGQRAVGLLTTPLLFDFLLLARQQNEDWANVLVSRVVGVLTDRPPETWTLTVSRHHTPAVIQALNKGSRVTVRHLITDPREISTLLPCIPLYIRRANNAETLLPEEDLQLQPGDTLLFCGREGAETHMRWTVHSAHAMDYICTGCDRPSGTLWRWLSERQGG
ncbi:MAG: NAD-binding protein [Gammaproteobacteria bacterium]|jgi:Trk K+ transport system NAD-binding subunit|nr:NAD-binding protein [Gammaproteobacteria bacterium]